MEVVKARVLFGGTNGTLVVASTHMRDQELQWDRVLEKMDEGENSGGRGNLRLNGRQT